MTRKQKTDQTKLAHTAALTLAGKSGWHAVKLADVAKLSKLPLAELQKRYSDIWDVLADILKKLEQDVRATTQDGLGNNWRDNLFEILMARFDEAQKNRPAFEKIASSVAKAPTAAARLAPLFPKTIAHMLDDAKVPENFCRPLQVAAFGVIYLSLVEVWMRDDTQDLSKTMAAVDQRLGYFEKMGSFKPAA